MEIALQIIVIATCFLSSATSSSDSREFSSLLKTRVDENNGDFNAVRANQRISGINGYCIDVKHEQYTDGNPIIVWYCKNSTNPTVYNQLWTFESDGTVRSNGTCLTTTGYDQGSNIVIHNCATAEKDATIWKLRIDGEILNPKSGLVITSLFGALGGQLSLQINISSSLQAWRVDNNTNPRLAKIVGMNGLCLQISGNAVWIDQCDSGNVGQEWLIYPDGTIRPKGSTIDCLGYDDLISNQTSTFNCGHGAASQRWLFTEKGAILNERSNRALDVARSNPSLKKILVAPPNGKPNQKWEIKYLSSSSII